MRRWHAIRSGCALRRTLPLLLAAAGCASGPAPRDHFYRVELAAPARLAEPVFQGTVRVERFRADALTSERALLHRGAGAEVERHSYHQWMDSPTVMLQSELTSYLRAAGAADRVVTPEVRVRPDYYVTGRIHRLERVLGAGPPGVVVELELSVTRAKRGELLLLEIYREQRAAGGDGMDAAVDAYREALAAIFARFLQDVSAT